MKTIPWILKWALRQSLGRERGDYFIGVLSGPVGAFLDIVFGREIAAAEAAIGKAEAELGRLLGNIK
jgi:hypothetical protein